MSNPNPVYVFTVDLTTLNPNSFLNPDMYNPSPDAGRASITNQTKTHITWIPGLLPGKNYELHHGDTLTEYGMQGQYLYNTYCNVENPILTLVSRTYA